MTFKDYTFFKTTIKVTQDSLPISSFHPFGSIWGYRCVGEAGPILCGWHHNKYDWIQVAVAKCLSD